MSVQIVATVITQVFEFPFLRCFTEAAQNFHFSECFYKKSDFILIINQQGQLFWMSRVIVAER